MKPARIITGVTVRAHPRHLDRGSAVTARLLGQNAAAKLLGVSVPKLLEWTAAGRLPVVHDTRNGKPWPRWSEAALIEWQQELGRIAARALNERGAA